MPEITAEDNRYFENKLYLPMLITILERDLDALGQLPFKLHRPYIALIEKALNYIRVDLKATDIYLLRNNMRLVRGKSDAEYTEYTFIHVGYEEQKRYSSVELRRKSEELLITYFVK